LDLLSSPGSAMIARLSGARFRVGMDTGRNNWCFNEVIPRKVTREGRTVVCYTADSNLETARLLGVPLPDPVMHREASVREQSYRTGFPAADRERAWADDYLKDLGEKRKGFAGIVPGAKYHSKAWPEENFMELARRLSDDLDLRPIVIWGPGEEDVADRLVEADKRIIKPPPTGIARLGALIGRLEVLVGIDSGPKHLAVIQGVPTVTVFGPTDPRVWDPMTPRHRAIFRNVDCRPCRDRDCGDRRCMDSIGAGEVAEAVAGVLSARDSDT
ncbi:MAG TPA: glycosyltransferase family 9 protein, partial [Candidatus Krumholzibacterium sp.]|nr:glycosyltransferase family 9 protein [Candidatus Krumholzibacterium sp.]